MAVTTNNNVYTKVVDLATPSKTLEFSEGKLTKFNVNLGQSNASLVFKDMGYSNGAVISDKTIGEFELSASKGTNSNSPKYYSTGEAGRFYGGNTLTISNASGHTIKSIALTFASGEDSNTITTNVATYSNGTWSGSANSVKFTIGGTSGHRRIQKLDITYLNCSIDDLPPATHSITFAQPASGGTFTVSVAGTGNISSGDKVEEGKTVTLTATPAENYKFSSWNVTGASVADAAAQTTTFTMGENDITISAAFAAKVSSAITITALSSDETDDGCSYSVSVGGSPIADQATVQEGETVTLAATNGSTYSFSSWSVYKSGDTETPVFVDNNSFVMPAYPVTIAASFAVEEEPVLPYGTVLMTADFAGMSNLSKGSNSYSLSNYQTGWSGNVYSIGTSGSACKEYIRIGTSSSATITSPTFSAVQSFEGTLNAELSFELMGWKNTELNSITVTIVGGGTFATSGETTYSATPTKYGEAGSPVDFDGDSFTVKINGAGPSTKLTFAGKRTFMDNVSVVVVK